MISVIVTQVVTTMTVMISEEIMDYYIDPHTSISGNNFEVVNMGANSPLLYRSLVHISRLYHVGVKPRVRRKLSNKVPNISARIVSPYSPRMIKAMKSALSPSYIPTLVYVSPWYMSE